MVDSTISAPSKEKLAAWAQVRDAWKTSGKPPSVTDAVLEAEYKAENTD
jgi:hypothetical protein